MLNQCIFYGAGRYAELNLETWLSKSIVPVCFADADAGKHYKRIGAYRIRSIIFPASISRG
jgi:hypothetical protein